MPCVRLVVERAPAKKRFMNEFVGGVPFPPSPRPPSALLRAQLLAPWFISGMLSSIFSRAMLIPARQRILRRYAIYVRYKQAQGAGYRPDEPLDPTYRRHGAPTPYLQISSPRMGCRVPASFSYCSASERCVSRMADSEMVGRPRE